jgi:ribosomal protein S20
MKSISLLRTLAKNPFYQLTPDEVEALKQADNQVVSSLDEDLKKKNVAKGTAAVKRIGKIEKHSTDPVTE